ncbi:MAG: threonylcarbamoyl-AMP synthase [Elusimicrobia bacterium RIFCSPLOWO2_02_FULL_39_32]|nr:MAG: threonylcarbamoyl-AMP synthase [Elusimicrobia bacterium RIFCSPHIGHO2_02_FULL_39_36]OGR93435.1 MAG: threonylcarbamoyl-AMP synthase [Elusimicrobia bacterium RIFCSPLOWO2_02_FULL_39_32]OGS00282.1 MAG: threonylcarbamoyl-AMP synthase [Elusimicrobia bacterium RIFCSPLOWO2_12_FULL_39_28]
MKREIKKAVRFLNQGGLVCFPTETVYGLGARLFDEQALQKIFKVKNRPMDNPLIVHIADLKELKMLTQNFPRAAFKLIEKFWPGPLTLVCKRSALAPALASAGLKTVAIRMPNHRTALELIRALGEPIAAPSANISGRPSSTRYQDVVRELGNKVNMVLKGEQSELGLESTVLDITRVPFRILRPGFVTLEKLKKVLPNICLAAKGKNKKVLSPGVKHQHYKPNCKVVLVEPQYWEKTLEQWQNQKTRLGVFSYSKKIPNFKNIVFNKMFHGNKFEMAKQLYSYFYDAEKAKVQTLLVETIEQKGIGLAFMDRLKRASA